MWDYQLFQFAAKHAVKVISLEPQEWSRSVALNAAAWAAPEAVRYVFTDADMIPDPDWRTVIEATLAAEIPREGTVWLTRSRDLPEGATAALENRYLADRMRLLALSSEHPAVGQGAAMVVPGEWFRRVGGFDEAYAVWGCEETDLLMRAVWDGLAVRWLPGTFAVHQWHRRDWPTAEQYRRIQRNRAHLAARARARGPVERNGPGSPEAPDGRDDWLAAEARAGVMAAVAFAAEIT